MEYKYHNMRFELSFWGGTINVYSRGKKIDEIELTDYQKSEIKECEKQDKRLGLKSRNNGAFASICIEWVGENGDIVYDE